MDSKQQQEQQQVAARPRNATSKHRCDHCGVEFTRSEHLKRHQTMHNKVKAYPCPFCGKKYARSDVLRRHYQNCKSAQNVDKASVEIVRRVNSACSSCRHSKVKCSGVQPCERCCSLGQSQLCRFTFRKARLADTSGNSTLCPQTRSNTEQYVLPSESTLRDHRQSLASKESLATVLPAVDQDLQDLKVGQEKPGPPGCDQIEMPFNTTQGVQLEQITSNSAPSTSPTNAFNNGPTDLDFMDLGADTYFDLDLLDWGIVENSFVANQDNQANTAWTESSIQQFISPEATTTSPFYGEDNSEGGITTFDLPAGMSLMQVSPLDAHRSHILQFLKESNQGSRRWNQWLTTNNMSLFIRSYFKSFHQHTPLLHLPFWNISRTSTRLVFAMVLMGAMYSSNSNFNGSEARKLCQMAQTFAWATDTRLQAGGAAQLDTIQAVYIVTLLEAFYFPFKPHRPAVDTKRLVYEARNAGVFDGVQTNNDPSNMRWEEWSAEECRIRTAFILYLFDAIRAIMFGQRPELRSYELRLPLPCDENMFAAGTEDVWQRLYMNAQTVTRIEYPIILSLFLCHQPMDAPLQLSVMGGFTVLHGILLYMWEQKLITSRRDGAESEDGTIQNARKHLADINSKLVDNALRLWRKNWQTTVARTESMASKGLYRDRALAYWYLGNLMNHDRWGPGFDVTPVSTNGTWTLQVPRLLRELTELMDAGQLDVLNDNTSSVAGVNLTPRVGDIPDNTNENAEVDGMDTIILGCMMRRDRQSED